MKEILDFLRSLGGLPPDQLVGIIAICAIGLSAFAIYVVHSIAKQGKRK
jgi:hypothetical protein